MSETPNHKFYNSESNMVYTGEILSPLDEAHELATDISWLGAAGVASEIAASHVTGTPTAVELPNPVTSKMLKKRIVLSEGGWGLAREASAEAIEADTDVRTTRAELEGFLADPTSTDTINQYIDKRLKGRRQYGWHWNDAMILEGVDVPPIIRDSMDRTAQQFVIPEKGMTFTMWYNAIPREQRINFAEWYDKRLKVLANSESRKEFIAGLKDSYVGHVQSAMVDGWIDTKYKSVLQKRMRDTDMRFFSPFGNVAREFGGAKQGNKSVIAMPTLTGPEIVTHELGHVFAGVSIKGLFDHFKKSLDEDALLDRVDAIAYLYTALNEGFNEHMTAALLNGSPEIISPVERTAHGIPEVNGASNSYKTYREIFGALVGGESGQFTIDDMRTVTGMMIEGDMSKFITFLSERWNGQDILMRLSAVTNDFLEARKEAPNMGEKTLTENLLTALRGSKNAATMSAA